MSGDWSLAQPRPCQTIEIYSLQTFICQRCSSKCVLVWRHVGTASRQKHPLGVHASAPRAGAGAIVAKRARAGAGHTPVCHVLKSSSVTLIMIVTQPCTSFVLNFLYSELPLLSLSKRPSSVALNASNLTLITCSPAGHQNTSEQVLPDVWIYHPETHCVFLWNHVLLQKHVVLWNHVCLQNHVFLQNRVFLRNHVFSQNHVYLQNHVFFQTTNHRQNQSIPKKN